MEVIICPRCKGVGRHEEHDHRESYFVDCERCNTTGKIHVCEMYMTLEIPYGADQMLLYDANSEIFKVFRICDKRIKEKLKKE